MALATSAELPDLDPHSQLLPPALAAAGVDAELAIWTDPDVDWSAFDAVVARSTWDYFDRSTEFRAWVERVGAEVPFFNPPDVVLWNAHKRYLRDLGERGVPVVDTLSLEPGDHADVPFAEAVVKPAVSGGSQARSPRAATSARRPSSAATSGSRRRRTRHGPRPVASSPPWDTTTCRTPASTSCPPPTARCAS